jgi:hypothetical protein
MSNFKNFEYEVHRVGPKDYGSQNFSFSACKGASLWYNFLRTATARDRRKFFYRSNHVFLTLKVLKRENQQKKNHFSRH